MLWVEHLQWCAMNPNDSHVGGLNFIRLIAKRVAALSGLVAVRGGLQKKNLSLRLVIVYSRAAYYNANDWKVVRRQLL